tara:strand:+ start:364 stop:1380 length:1017 start_codon:yes stop_codon:yes gene_type:complete
MEKNRDLFKEAIADARAVKEVSIANAKAALEEVITPRLKSMFEKKLTEMEEEDEKQEEGYEMKKENSEIEEEFNLEELLAELDEVEDEKVHEEEATGETVTESEETMEEEAHEEEIYEEEETEEEEAEEADEDEEDDSDVEIDFDNMTEEDLRAFIEEVVDEMIEAEELELAEPSEEDEEVEIEDDAEIGDEEEVEIEDEISSLELEEGRINKKQASQLTAALETINTLRSELNEVNLLNSKLLYLNKILKETTLRDSQKVKVITAFDKAQTVKDVKLIFETLKESLVSIPAKRTTKNLVRESKNFASSTITEASPAKKPVMEVDPVIMRMKKLAGLL